MKAYMHVHESGVITYADKCPVCVAEGKWPEETEIPRD